MTEEEDDSSAGPVRQRDTKKTSLVCTRSTNNSSGDLPTPPDGGWGWIVVFASFMINFIGTYCIRLAEVKPTKTPSF